MDLLPDTVDAIEVLWVVLNTAAAAASALEWRNARQDLAYVQASKRKHLARSFVEDVRDARGRMLLALAMTAVGLVAMTQPQAAHRPPQGWIIVALLFYAPIQIMRRTLSKAMTRRAITHDVARATRNQPPHPGEDE